MNPMACRMLSFVFVSACAGCASIPAGSRTAPELRPLFDEINARAFDGRLAAELRTVADSQAYGRTQTAGAADGSAVIVLDSALHGEARRAVMAHEMVHLNLSCSGNFMVRLSAGGHGQTFTDECRRVAKLLRIPVEAMLDDPYLCDSRCAHAH